MPEIKITGFIGCGNMAAAIMEGMVRFGISRAQHIHAYDVDASKTDALKDSLGIAPEESAADLVDVSDIVFLCVKPNVMEPVLNEIRTFDTAGKSFVSIAAGWSAARIGSVLGADKKMLRLMPNTPLMAGEGMTVFEKPSNIPQEDYAFVRKVFGALGQTAEAGAKWMDAVTAVSGSGPAYAYLFIDALADGGVLQGLPRELAIRLAAQTVLGAAKMVLQTDAHPCALKDAVCSPGGTTIEAVKVLEDHALKGIVIQAVEACAEKSRRLSVGSV